MESRRQQQVRAALEGAGWRLGRQENGEYWGRHPEQPQLNLSVGSQGGIRWRGRQLGPRRRPRPGDAPGIAEAIEAARRYDEEPGSDANAEEPDETSYSKCGTTANAVRRGETAR